MANVIDAVKNIVSDPLLEVKKYYNSRHRINGEGKALEEYVKDVFAGTLRENNKRSRQKRISETFSYFGNDNNPPDSILKGGDAIEVKKIENMAGTIQLNSSFPCQRISSSSPMITEACSKVDGGGWIKDLLYAIGTVKGGQLKALFLIYGMDFAADEKVYTRIKRRIKESIEDIGASGIAETNELGRINDVDPLGYTSLRVRGMWLIMNPWKAFDYLDEVASVDKTNKFNFCAILNDEKIKTFDNYKDLDELKKAENVTVSDVEIKNPDNPAEQRNAKLIQFGVS